MYVSPFLTVDRQSDAYGVASAWSAPSAIGTAGLGVGTQAGAEMTDFLIVLNTQSVSELCPSAIPRICREADTIEFICRQLYGSSLSRSRDSG